MLISVINDLEENENVFLVVFIEGTSNEKKVRQKLSSEFLCILSLSVFEKITKS